VQLAVRVLHPFTASLAQGNEMNATGRVASSQARCKIIKWRMAKLHLPGGTDENHDKLRSILVFGWDLDPRFR